jgi:hypothetical protein
VYIYQYLKDKVLGRRHDDHDREVPGLTTTE